MTERAVDRLTARDREMIGEVRRQIERRGHFQGTSANVFGACLIRNSPLTERLMPTAQARVMAAIIEAAGVDVAESNLCVTGETMLAVTWNDAVKTDEVLDVLAALEVG